MSPQLRLPLTAEADFSRRRFAVSDNNAAAVALVDDFRSGALALVGPEGSGKTHLAHLWADEKGCRFLNQPPGDIAALTGQRLVIEHADAWPDAESLFHLINMAQVSGALLLTSRQRPVQWPAALPDLRSRLNGLVVAELPEPDDAILTAMLKAFLRERHIRPADDLIPYLLPRMERTALAAREVAQRLDDVAAGGRREVNRALAADVLGRPDNRDLFNED